MWLQRFAHNLIWNTWGTNHCLRNFGRTDSGFWYNCSLGLLRIMVPWFTSSTRNLVAHSHLLWLIGCCIAKVVQLSGNWVFGRAWLEEAAWLFGVFWSRLRSTGQMSIEGIFLLCFSCWILGCGLGPFGPGVEHVEQRDCISCSAFHIVSSTCWNKQWLFVDWFT